MTAFIVTACAYILSALSHILPSGAAQFLPKLLGHLSIHVSMLTICNIVGLIGFILALFALRHRRQRLWNIVALLVSLPFVYNIVCGIL